MGLKPFILVEKGGGGGFENFFFGFNWIGLVKEVFWVGLWVINKEERTTLGLNYSLKGIKKSLASEIRYGMRSTIYIVHFFLLRMKKKKKNYNLQLR